MTGVQTCALPICSLAAVALDALATAARELRELGTLGYWERAAAGRAVAAQAFRP